MRSNHNKVCTSGCKKIHSKKKQLILTLREGPVWIGNYLVRKQMPSHYLCNAHMKWWPDRIWPVSPTCIASMSSGMLTASMAACCSLIHAMRGSATATYWSHSSEAYTRGRRRCVRAVQLQSYILLRPKKARESILIYMCKHCHLTNTHSAQPCTFYFMQMFYLADKQNWAMFQPSSAHAISVFLMWVK